MYFNRLFFTVILVAGGCLARSVWGAPTIKNFGNTVNSNVYSGVHTNKTTQPQSQSNATAKRASSVRALSLTTKPAPKTYNNDTGTADKPASSVASVRRSGKHANLVKGISSKLSSSHTSQLGTSSDTNISDLEQRVSSLESEITTKQGLLESGDGISIDGNTISLDDNFADLPNKIEEMNQDIEDLADQIGTAPLPSDYYTAAQTEEYMEQHYYNKQYVDDIVGALTGHGIADEFVPTFLTNGQ